MKKSDTQQSYFATLSLPKNGGNKKYIEGDQMKSEQGVYCLENPEGLVGRTPLGEEGLNGK